MVRKQSSARITLAMLHGFFLWDDGLTVDYSGKVLDGANPWLKQFYDDVKQVAQLCHAFEQLFVRRGWWAIFESQDFLRFNAHRLRSFR